MILGLTGGIGSGKSTVARLFEILGYAVFNSDVVAKQVYFDDAIKQQVIALLGKEAYLTSQSLNKQYISTKIFSNTELLHKLNAIIHPAVKNRMVDFVEANKQKTVVKETALLFEVGLNKEVDKIILVASDDELRIARVMARDGLTRDEVLKKIKSQLPQEEKIKRADYIIYNNEQLSLIEQVLAIKEQIVATDSTDSHR
jgi:dephospho-CoA kinase